MTAAAVTRDPPKQPSSASTRRPALTAVVCGVTLAVSIAALASPALMRLFVRNLPHLLTGQWWRVVTPVLVQPSGWGQLVFNLLGIAVIGAALQRRLGWAGWSLIYLAGGPGTIALYIAWHPGDTGGGSSAAVAALIGALAVLLAAGADLGRLEWFAQLYSVFFAVYLTALQLGGVLPSVIAGNASIIVMVAARHAVRSTTLTRASLVAVLVAGVAMTAARDDHGAGILIGVTVACLILSRRRILAHPLAPGTLTVLFDLAAPIALYYGLRSAGVGIVPSLIAGTAAPAGSGIVQAIRHRRIDALAVTVVILLVLSAGVSVIAGSPRFLLAKDAVLTAVRGTWFLLSLRGHRPLTFRFTRPLLEAHRIFDPRTRTWSAPTERSWDELWELVPRFRRMWQVTTMIWGAAFLLDAALRVVMAYALPVNDVPALAGALWLVTFLLFADHHERLSQPLGPLAHLARPSADRPARPIRPSHDGHGDNPYRRRTAEIVRTQTAADIRARPRPDIESAPVLRCALRFPWCTVPQALPVAGRTHPHDRAGQPRRVRTTPPVADSAEGRPNGLICAR
ncbi:MAG TPA: VC0807 family protein [Streptosporangiaceae bacterium]